MAINYINTTKELFLKENNGVLFKYMPYNNVRRFLKDSDLNMWMAAPSLWEDPYEKLFINAQYGTRKKHDDYLYKDQVYCTCFTNNASSEAQWKNYVKSGLAICFTVSRSDLITALEKYASQNLDCKIFIGKVEYKTTDKIKKHSLALLLGANYNNRPNYLVELLFLKRNAFKFEDETRIVIVTKEKAKCKTGILIPMAPNGCKPPIQTAKVGKCSTERFNSIQSYLRKKLPNVNINKSQLYTDPLINPKNKNYIYIIDK